MASTTPASAAIVGVDIFGPITSNAAALVAFYRDTLGLMPTEEDPTGAEFELADGSTFGVYQPGEDATKGGGYTALFAVRDINAAVAEMRSRGAEMSDPMETPVCFMSLGKDPDGNEYWIHQRKTEK